MCNGNLYITNHRILNLVRIMIIAKTKVTSGFRIMIPKAIRDSQGIENGTNVIWYEKEMRGSISGGKDLSKIRTTDLLDEEFGLS